jgi:hypothetical protein
MKDNKIPPGNDFQIRCPKLGHQIYFSYCRTENFGLPCVKTLNCWHIYFPVVDFLREELTPEEWEKSFEEPVKPRIVSFYELVEKAGKDNRS